MSTGPAIFIPIISVISICLTIFGIYYIKGRQNMALIDRGINPQQNKLQPKPFQNLKYGLLFLGAGVGLMMAYILDVVIMKHGTIIQRGVDAANNSWSDVSDTREPVIYFAMIAIGGGLGLIMSYRVEKKQWLDKQPSE